MSLQVDAVRPRENRTTSSTRRTAESPPGERGGAAASSRLGALFYAGAVLLILFEVMNVWFIMPLPGSQRMRSIDIAYAVHQWRWGVRMVAGLMLLTGLVPALRPTGWRRLAPVALLLVVGGVVWMANFRMAADQMFRQPSVLTMASAATNAVPRDRLVVGIEVNGEARAYPLMFIGYHHQVRDIVGGREVLVSYCTVCRTGRVFSPLVGGKSEQFRLVGMDHWNAMFEDESTGSWWRQANGEAVTGHHKGKALDEIPSWQVTLGQWLAMHPTSLVMQADPAFTEQYAKDYSYEKGTSRKSLTGTDTTSWGEKSWVVGVVAGGSARAFDWNQLKRERVINDVVGETPVVIALASDSASFFAYVRPRSDVTVELRGDSLVMGGESFALDGRGASDTLRSLPASQEFWHSWRTFHPATTKH